VSVTYSLVSVAAIGDPVERVRLVPLHRWSLWTAPKRVVVLVFAVGAAAVSTAMFGVVAESVDRTDWARFGGLAVLSCVYVAACRRVERARHFMAVSRGAAYADVMSVWTLAAAIVLPPGLAAALVTVVYLQSWFGASVLSDGRPRLYRFVYSVAAAILTCELVPALLDPLGVSARGQGLGGAIAVIAAIVPLYITVNTLIIGAAIYASTGIRKPAMLFGSSGAFLSARCPG